MSPKNQYIFETLKDSTAFKRKLNESKIFDIGIADLNAHLLDNFLIGQFKQKNAFKYFANNLIWILSKIVNKKINKTQATILFVPAELDKERSIGLYKPLLKYIKVKNQNLIGLNKVFNSISIATFFSWIIKIPTIIRTVLKILNDIQYSEKLEKIKWIIVIDSIFHYLWVMQLQCIFKNSNYKTVVVDWDRHKLHSLIIIAAKREKIKSFTFIHGAIYTPEKFVPLIADSCFVWGNNHIDFFTNLGEENKKLLKVGNTRFHDNLPDRQVVLNKYKIKTNKRIILHPSQNFPDLEDHVIIRDLHNFISKNKNFQLAVKFHPSQNNIKLLDKIKNLENLIILDPSITAHEALAIANFTIIVSSTFAIDSLISDVPVAIYKPKMNLRGIAIDLVAKAKAPLLQTEKEFLDFLETSFNNQLDYSFDRNAQRNFIKNYCESFGDKSAKLISNLI